MGFLSVSREFIHKIIEIIAYLVDAILDLFNSKKKED